MIMIMKNNNDNSDGITCHSCSISRMQVVM